MIAVVTLSRQKVAPQQQWQLRTKIYECTRIHGFATQQSTLIAGLAIQMEICFWHRLGACMYEPVS